MTKTENEPGDSFDNTLELTLENVKERAVKGIVVLTSRTFFLQILSFVAMFFLTVFLGPEEFGVFFIISAVVNFLAYFSDVGLGAALIQSKKKITNDDLKTTFTVQQGLVLSIIVLLFLATPWIRNYYDLSQEGVYLLYALGASLLMSSFKTIPSVLLERELEFVKWTVPQILEQLVYNVTVVILAWQGYGIMSFTYAILARGLVGLVAVYILRPWFPELAFSRKSLSRLLKYGVPYQANTLLATIKDDGLTAFLGGILGATTMGYLGWAQKWAKTPLRLFMDNVLKVSFPTFSRMQDEKDELAHAVTRSVFFICFFVFPSLIGFLILAPMLLDIIPRYEKWLPALIPLYIVSVDTLFAASTTQVTNTLNAIGRINTTFKLMIMWTTLAWLIIPFLSIRYGLVGASIGYAMVSSSSIVAIILAKRYVNFSMKDALSSPVIATVVMAIAMIITMQFLGENVVTLIALSTLGGFVYVGMMYILRGSLIVQDVKKVARNLYKRS